MNIMNITAFAVRTEDVPVRVMLDTAGALFDRYTPQLAGVVPVEVVSTSSVIAGDVSDVDHVFCTCAPNAEMTRASALVGVEDGVVNVVAAVASCPMPTLPCTGVDGSYVPVVTAMTQPAHLRAVAKVHWKVSPPAATFRTTSTEHTAPSATNCTKVAPDGRAVGAVPAEFTAMPISKSPATKPRGMVGVNVSEVAAAELPVPVERTVAGTVRPVRRTQTKSPS